MKKKFQKKVSREKDSSVGKRKKPVKKKENLSREIRFSRDRVRKAVSWFIFLLIFASLFFNVIFFSKYQTIRNNVQASEDRIDEKLYKVEEREVGFSDAVESFGEDFLEVYYNVPAEKESREKRLDTLRNYFVSGFKIEDLESLEDFKGSRSLTDLRYLETKQIDTNKANLVFEVSYEIKDKDTVSDSVQIVIPVVSDGKGFAVYEKPSLTSRDFTSDITLDDTSLEGDDVSSTEKEQLDTFLHEFFTSYGVSDEKLPFMANLERGLKRKVLSSAVIRDSAINEEGVYQLVVDVLYQNEETTFNSMYTYYLEATKDKNNYFIENIKQGGF